MSEERELTTIRTLPWDGTKDDWRMWSTKFEMRAKQRGYAKILTGVQTGVPNPNEEEPTDEALKKLYKLQANGYCDLLLAMKDKASFNLVKEANSHLHEAWEALKTKYAPSTKADTVRLMAQFQTSKLENVKHDVDEWVSSVEILRQELKGLGKTIDDDDFIIQILAGLPEEYMEITHSLTKDLESGTLTPKKMRAELKDRYKTMKGFNKWSDKDVALNMTDKPQQGGGGFKKHYKKPFKGRCNNCGKIGHKAADCWDREENKSKRPNNWKSPKKPDNNNNNNNNNNSGGSGRFGGKCWNCGERGHTSANCPKKDNDEVNIANEKVQDHVLLCYEVIEQPAAEVLPISVDDIDLAAAVPDAFWDDFEMIDTESDDIVSGPDGTSTMELNLLEEWINTPSKNNPHSFGCMGMHTTTTCSKLEPKHKADHEAEHDSDDELCKLNFDNMQETETCKLNFNLPDEDEHTSDVETKDLCKLDFDDIAKIMCETAIQLVEGKLKDDETTIQLVEGKLEDDESCGSMPIQLVKGKLEDDESCGSMPIQLVKGKLEDDESCGSMPALVSGNNVVPMECDSDDASIATYNSMPVVIRRPGGWVAYDSDDSSVDTVSVDVDAIVGFQFDTMWITDDEAVEPSADDSTNGSTDDSDTDWEPDDESEDDDDDYSSDDSDGPPPLIPRNLWNSDDEDSDGDTTLGEPDDDNGSEMSGDADYPQHDTALMMTGTTFDRLTDDIWIGDTGATCHLVKSAKGLYDVEAIKDCIIMGDCREVAVTQRGNLDLMVHQKDGKQHAKSMRQIKVLPGAQHNVLSIPMLLSSGWKCQGQYTDKAGLHVAFTKKGQHPLIFDRLIRSGQSFLLGVKMKRLFNQVNAMTSKGSKMTRQKMHQLLGHCGHDVSNMTAKAMGVELSGTFRPCLNCAEEKIRKNVIPKESHNKATEPGGRIFLDISSMKTSSLGGNKHWLLAVDEASGFKKSWFMGRKSDQYNLFVDWVKDLKAKHEIAIKCVRLDNSGENNELVNRCKAEGLGIKFEFTAPGTPQSNGTVERAFPALMGRTRAMMNQAGFTKQKREQLKFEAANTATDLDNVLIKEQGGETQWKKFFGTDAPYMQHLHIFGEIAVTKDPADKTKIESRGRTCIFLGYAENHAGNVSRFYNMNTGRIVLSRDVQWMDEMYAEHVGVKRAVPLDDDSSVESIEEPNTGSLETETEDTPQLGGREQSRLTWDATTAGHTEPGENLGRTRSQTRANADTVGLVMEKWMHDVCLISAVSSGIPEEPKTFDEAWNHPDPKRDIPEGRRLVGCKWVFKIKRNGVYRARLVALGYSQIPGVDFQDNYAPVINDVTFRLMLIRVLVEGLKTRAIDIETAFLHGDLEEEIYMTIPRGYVEAGYEVGPDDCCALGKCIYGLVQAARQYWKKFVKTLEQYGFQVSKADPCLMYREDENGICMIVIYVDDCVLVGTEQSIDVATKQIQEHFTIKIEDELNDYLGCEIKLDLDRKRGWISQPHIIKNLKAKFAEEVRHLKSTKTPGTPGYGFVKPKSEDEHLSNDMQAKYRSGVGTLLYLVKHSRPDLANPVRELTKGMDGATMAAFKEMHRLIKHVLDTEEYGLKLFPTVDKTWELIAFSDSDFATDKDTRISVTGFIIYFMGVAVAWKSRGQKSVSLSSTESEFYA